MHVSIMYVEHVTQVNVFVVSDSFLSLICFVLVYVGILNFIMVRAVSELPFLVIHFSMNLVTPQMDAFPLVSIFL